MEWAIILLVLFVIIVLFILAVILLSNAKTVYAPSSTPGVTAPPGFGFSCKTDPCPSNFVCDVGTVSCRLPLGATCTDFSQCQTGNFCSGVCVTGPNGGVRQPCPCNSGLVCTTQSDGSRICLGSPGFPCTVNDDCLSNFCLGGTCSSGSANGFPCTSDSQCVSGNCDEFQFCQPPNVLSGTTGAVCIFGQPPPGTPGATGAGCDPGLFCSNGVCLPGNGLAEACGISSACALPLICTSLDTGQACGASQNCICLFPNDPNTCPQGACLADNQYQCETTTSQCLAFGNQPCVINQDCNGTACLASPTILTFESNGVSRINPIGATIFSWDIHSSPPTTFTKLAGFTSVTDKLYGVASNGLYTFSGSSWTQIIPSPLVVGPSTKILVSVAATANLTLVVFKETVGLLTDYTVYSLNGLTLTPFNVNSQVGHIDGTQYSVANVALPISDIDISSNLDVVLLSSNNPFVKTPNVTQYSLRDKTNGSIITGPPITNVILPRFYFDTFQTGATGATVSFPSDYNFGYVGPTGPSQLLQFNGNISGALYPRDLGTPDVHNVTDWSVFTPSNCVNNQCGLRFGTMELVSLDQNLGSFHDYLVINGVQVKIPGFVDNQARVLVTELNIYLYVPSVCSF